MSRFESVAKPLMWLIALMLIAFVAGCLGGSSGGPNLRTAKAITAYSLAGNMGTINEPAMIIAVTVPYGTDLTALVATFTTVGKSVKVGNTAQTSGTTPNNFTSPVAYIVTAIDGTKATYKVTVTVAAASSKTISAFSFVGYTGATGTINEPAKIIAVSVPNGTNVTALVATFVTTGTSVNVGSSAQVSGTTPNDFTSPVAYKVTAADGTTATYNVTVTVSAATSNAISAFSFVGYTGATGTFSGSVSPYAIAVTVPNGTDVTVLAATFVTTGASVSVGTTVQTSAATLNDFSSPVAYVVTAADGTTATYNVTVTVAAATSKAITAFSFVGYTGATGTISGTGTPYTIAVTVPNGTNRTALVSTFVTTGASVSVGATVQTSAATANDFSSPVAYVVTAADGSTATYNVTVTVAASSAKAITAFSFATYGATGTISGTAPTFAIAVSVPNGTSLTGLVATFTTTGASVKVGGAGGTVQTSGSTPNNFSPVAYTVIAADGTTATYNVTVTVAAATTDLPGAGTNPTVHSSSPTNGDINVPTSSNSTIAAVNNTVTGKLVKATFSEAMSASSVAAAFTLWDTTAASSVPGTVTMNTATTEATFKPTAAALTPGDIYTATITTAAVTSPAGTPITKTVAWSFTTSASALTGQEPVDLLSVLTNNFVILADVNGITDVPTSHITGNIGVSTTAGATAIGVPCSEMTGTIYAPASGGPGCAIIDSTLLTTAISDMGTASVEAAGRTQLVPVTGLGAGDISGMTLTPGIYTWSSSLLINSGSPTGDATGVTLNCQGNSNAVFIFQASSFLTVGSGAQVNLIGSCLAKNIFWSLAGDATLSSTSVFNGTILTATQVVMQSGAALHGRALAHTWVTLISNTVGQ